MRVGKITKGLIKDNLVGNLINNINYTLCNYCFMITVRVGFRLGLALIKHNLIVNLINNANKALYI